MSLWFKRIFFIILYSLQKKKMIHKIGFSLLNSESLSVFFSRRMDPLGDKLYYNNYDRSHICITLKLSHNHTKPSPSMQLQLHRQSLS